MLVTLYKIGEVHFGLLGANGFHAKERMKVLLLRARVVVKTSKMKISRRHLADYVKICTKKRAARLFFLIQPIKSFICGGVVAVAVFIS